mgnify:CR=1 FL=1
MEIRFSVKFIPYLPYCIDCFSLFLLPNFLQTMSFLKILGTAPSHPIFYLHSNHHINFTVPFLIIISLTYAAPKFKFISRQKPISHPEQPGTQPHC